MTIANQTFGYATLIDDVFGYQPIDGFMGLAWPDVLVDDVISPLQNLQPQLDQTCFVVWLDK